MRMSARGSAKEKHPLRGIHIRTIESYMNRMSNRLRKGELK